VTKNAYIIPNLKRSIDVLDLLADHHEGITLAEVSETLKIPKTTALRILSTFSQEQITTKRDGKYAVGTRLVQLAMRALAGWDLRKLASPILKEVCHKTNETTHLVVLSGEYGLIMEVCEALNPVKATSTPGTLLQLHCSAVGKVLLAYTKAGHLREFFNGRRLEKINAKTINGYRELEKEMIKIRECGYAVDDCEYHENVRCLAAPVWDSYGEVVAAVGITASATTFTKDKDEEYARYVIQGAQKLSHAMGGQCDAAYAKSIAGTI
jgi:DNA-binding IclR family transcriptional regulator